MIEHIQLNGHLQERYEWLLHLSQDHHLQNLGMPCQRRQNDSSPEMLSANEKQLGSVQHKIIFLTNTEIPITPIEYLELVRDLSPLFFCWINSSRIVCTSMKQEEGIIWCILHNLRKNCPMVTFFWRWLNIKTTPFWKTKNRILYLDIIHH